MLGLYQDVPYSPKFSCFDEIQLFRDKIFAFNPKMNTHKGVTIIFAITFSRSVSFCEKHEIYSPQKFRAIRYLFSLKHEIIVVCISYFECYPYMK